MYSRTHRLLRLARLEIRKGPSSFACRCEEKESNQLACRARHYRACCWPAPAKLSSYRIVLPTYLARNTRSISSRFQLQGVTESLPVQPLLTSQIVRASFRAIFFNFVYFSVFSVFLK